MLAPDAAEARALWREYYTELSNRWFLTRDGELCDPDVLEREIVAESGAELAPPTGALLVARCEGDLAGCAGLRLLGDGRGELTRLFVRAQARGRGAGDVLLAAVEDQALVMGARRLVLDTRSDLVEARALYSRSGYVETPSYNDSEYAEHWFVKELRP